MTYSHELFPNVPSSFPPPPRWLTWSQDVEYTSVQDPTQPHGWRYESTPTEKGKLRHHDTLQVAKRNVGWCGRGEGYGIRGQTEKGLFGVDWAVYEWVHSKYVLRYSGKAGEVKADNPLFKKGAVSSKKQTPVQAVHDDEMDAVLNSILGQGSLA